MQQQITAQAKYAAEFGRRRNTRKDRHCAALGETTDDNARGGNAGINFALDQRVEVVTRLEDAGFVFACLKIIEIELSGGY